MSMENQIQHYELAEIMAYAEKPYQDLAISDPKSGFERSTLHDLANYAGITAAKAYIADLSAQIDHFDTNPQCAAPQEHSNEADNDLHEKLDTRLEDFIVAPDLSKFSNRVINALERENIRTLRDVLVWGKSNITDIRNLGDLSFKIIDNSVNAKLGDQSHLWANSLSLREIAQVCSDLHQVSSVILPVSVMTYYSRKQLSIQVILDTPEEELAIQFRYADRRDDTTGGHTQRPNYEKAAEVKGAAKAFAERFNKARSQA